MSVRQNLVFVFVPLVVGLSLLMALGYKTSPETAFVVSFTISTFTILFSFRLIEVEGYRRLIVSRSGRYYDTRIEGGRALLLRFVERPIIVDMRPRTIEICGIRCYTRDNFPVDVEGCFLWQVADPVRFILGPRNMQNTLTTRVVSALQNTINNMDIDRVLKKRADLDQAMTAAIWIPNNWGVRVLSTEVKDIDLPPESQAAYNMEVDAKRFRRAARIQAAATAEAFQEFEQVLGPDTALELYKLGVLTNGSWFWSPLDALGKGNGTTQAGQGFTN